MIPTVELLDERSAAKLPPQADEWSERARRFVGALLRDGSGAYVDNVDADLGLLRVDDRLLPVVRPHPVRRPADPMRPPADVVSPRSHYADYTQEELRKRHPRIPAGLIDAGFAVLRASLALGSAERIVYVNNWLLATNPVADLSRDEIDAITEALAERHPEEAIVFRTVDPILRPRLFSSLRGAGYRMVRCRRIWALDPRRAPLLANENVRRDLRLIERTGYEVVDDPALLEGETGRMIDLYRDVYLDKHSRLNPQFRAELLRMTLREGILQFRALRRNGEIDAWAAWFVRDGLMTASLIGYDRSRPRELGLYRQCIALLVHEAERKGLPLHLSAGADHFKRMRGAFSSEEYEAIRDRHLATRRRLPWALLAVVERLAAGGFAPVSRARPSPPGSS